MIGGGWIGLVRAVAEAQVGPPILCASIIPGTGMNTFG